MFFEKSHICNKDDSRLRYYKESTLIAELEFKKGIQHGTSVLYSGDKPLIVAKYWKGTCQFVTVYEGDSIISSGFTEECSLTFGELKFVEMERSLLEDKIWNDKKLSVVDGKLLFKGKFLEIGQTVCYQKRMITDLDQIDNTSEESIYICSS